MADAGSFLLTSPGARRRGVYFAYQGLLTAVLLLLFVFFHPDGQAAWSPRFAALAFLLTGSLGLIRAVPERVLGRWWFQSALFLGDALLAFLTLYWTQDNPHFFLLYLLVLFGTALSRNMLQSLAMAAVTSLLYAASTWLPSPEALATPEFWLRMHFLWIMAILLALLSRDNQRALSEQQDLYQESLIQMTSLAALGQLAGEVAHRIKGPLTTIQVNAELLSHRRQGASSRVRKELKQILEEVEHCKEILKRLLDLGRIEEMAQEPFDLLKPLGRALQSVRAQARLRGVRVDVRLPEKPLKARGDESLLQEVFFAVLQNALDACSEEGRIEVEGATLEKPAWPWSRPERRRRLHRFVIRDDGVGIPSESLGRIFRPFFTTKRQEGSGLGLSASLRILQKHGGTIELRSDGPGKGAEAVIEIPAA